MNTPQSQEAFRLDGKRIWIAGHRGMVGSALLRALDAEGFPSPLTATHDELALRNQSAVQAFFEQHRPTHVFLTAAITVFPPSGTLLNILYIIITRAYIDKTDSNQSPK